MNVAMNGLMKDFSNKRWIFFTVQN